jgi:hypothetical protein
MERAAEDDAGHTRPAVDRVNDQVRDQVNDNDGPCRPLPGGWLDLPPGSTVLASREVVLGDALASLNAAP